MTAFFASARALSRFASSAGSAWKDPFIWVISFERSAIAPSALVRSSTTPRVSAGGKSSGPSRWSAHLVTPFALSTAYSQKSSVSMNIVSGRSWILRIGRVSPAQKFTTR